MYDPFGGTEANWSLPDDLDNDGFGDVNDPALDEWADEMDELIEREYAACHARNRQFALTEK